MKITFYYLNQCASLSREAKDALERIDRIRSMLERVTQSMERIPCAGSAEPDKISDGVVNLIEMERAAIQKYGAYLEYVKIVEHELDAIPDPNQRRILKLRYLDGLLWEEISEKTIFHERWCRELHNRGLKEIGLFEEYSRKKPVES